MQSIQSHQFTQIQGGFNTIETAGIAAGSSALVNLVAQGWAKGPLAAIQYAALWGVCTGATAALVAFVANYIKSE